MAISGINQYGSMYDNAYSVREKRSTEKGISGENRAEGRRGTSEGVSERNEDYLKGLQEKLSYVELEIGWSLSMKRDRRSAITVNPKLLERMQNDPEAEKRYTQTLKDIERAEQTANAYYNATGGVVERTSHWYVDENGDYSHFAYTRRDDKLNKRLREEAKKNAETLIEKTREKARKKKAEQQEQLAERAEETKKEEEKQESRQEKWSVNMQAPDAGTAEPAEKPLMEMSENVSRESSQRAGEPEAGRMLDVKL